MIVAAQAELFLLDSPLYGEVRGERSIMAFPFFALTKNAQMKPLTYKMNNVAIEMRPSASGVATIYDKEVILYIASLIVAKLDRGDTVTQEFSFTANDLFRVTGTSSSARSYERLSDALTRLQGTQIRTNIEAGGEGEEGWFSWFSEAKTTYRIGKNNEKRLRSVQVRLCDWLYRAIVKDRRILTYNLAYFDLGPIERRLYELARSLCEDGSEFEVELKQLALQVGSQDTVARFKQALKTIVRADELPDYHIAMHDVVAVDPELPLVKRKSGRPTGSTIVTIKPRARSSRPRASLSDRIEARP
jgi:plasmid replication initiation protein